jgi:hypothetical protein
MNQINEIPGVPILLLADEIAVMSDWQSSLTLGDAE